MQSQGKRTGGALFQFVERFLNIYVERFLNIFVERFLNIFVERFLNIFGGEVFTPPC